MRPRNETDIARDVSVGINCIECHLLLLQSGNSGVSTIAEIAICGGRSIFMGD